MADKLCCYVCGKPPGESFSLVTMSEAEADRVFIVDNKCVARLEVKETTTITVITATATIEVIQALQRHEGCSRFNDNDRALLRKVITGDPSQESEAGIQNAPGPNKWNWKVRTSYKPWQLRMIKEGRCIQCGGDDLAEVGKIKKRKALKCNKCLRRSKKARAKRRKQTKP